MGNWMGFVFWGSNAFLLHEDVLAGSMFSFKFRFKLWDMEYMES